MQDHHLSIGEQGRQGHRQAAQDGADVAAEAAACGEAAVAAPGAAAGRAQHHDDVREPEPTAERGVDQGGNSNDWFLGRKSSLFQGPSFHSTGNFAVQSGAVAIALCTYIGWAKAYGWANFF